MIPGEIMSKVEVLNPTSDEDLPVPVRNRLQLLLDGGVPREHVIITEDGQVFVDEEMASYEMQMKRMYPDRPREEYMSIVYPSKIVVNTDA